MRINEEGGGRFLSLTRDFKRIFCARHVTSEAFPFFITETRANAQFDCREPLDFCNHVLPLYCSLVIIQPDFPSTEAPLPRSSRGLQAQPISYYLELLLDLEFTQRCSGYLLLYVQ